MPDGGQRQGRSSSRALHLDPGRHPACPEPGPEPEEKRAQRPLDPGPLLQGCKTVGFRISGSSEQFVGSGSVRVRSAATGDMGVNDLKQHREAETVTPVPGAAFDRSYFRREVSATVRSLEQDQSECQIEWQNRASEGLSRACECLSGLVFFEGSAVYLR